LALAAAVVLLTFASPALSYTWLGPFPDVPVVTPVDTAPPMDQTVPPIFNWTETPPADVVADLSPPGGGVDVRGAPEPATVITSLIGAGALSLAGLWRKRRRPA
jgi:hypothetical protein